MAASTGGSGTRWSPASGRKASGADLAGLPVLVDNEAHVAALGEAVCGAGRGCDPVF